MMEEESDISLRITSNLAVADEWVLVLVAEGLSPTIRRTGNKFVLGVSANEAERATAALVAYEKENPVEPPEIHKPAGAYPLLTGIAVAGALLAFFIVTGEPNSSGHWFPRGSSDARLILQRKF